MYINHYHFIDSCRNTCILCVLVFSRISEISRHLPGRGFGITNMETVMYSTVAQALEQMNAFSNPINQDHFTVRRSISFFYNTNVGDFVLETVEDKLNLSDRSIFFRICTLAPLLLEMVKMSDRHPPILLQLQA